MPREPSNVGGTVCHPFHSLTAAVRVGTQYLSTHQAQHGCLTFLSILTVHHPVGTSVGEGLSVCMKTGGDGGKEGCVGGKKEYVSVRMGARV